MEKLLVAQALDERDLLKKKINDAIVKSKYVEVCKEKDTTIRGVKIEDEEKKIVADWQSIKDMIDRYNRINRAIIQSNAVTVLKFKNGLEMTKAEAIALKNSKKDTAFTINLILYAKSAFESASRVAAKIELDQDRTRDTHMASLLQGTDKKVVDQELAATVENFVKPFGPKWINPLDIEEKINELTKAEDEFNSEVETLIKISNATTEIEF